MLALPTGAGHCGEASPRGSDLKLRLPLSHTRCGQQRTAAAALQPQPLRLLPPARPAAAGDKATLIEKDVGHLEAHKQGHSKAELQPVLDFLARHLQGGADASSAAGAGVGPGDAAGGEDPDFSFA
jgi:hypothetical protein